MTTVDEIKAAIAQLPPEALDELREWYEHFDAQLWDEQLILESQLGSLLGHPALVMRAPRSRLMASSPE